jgi:hypothetical protein
LKLTMKICYTEKCLWKSRIFEKTTPSFKILCRQLKLPLLQILLLYDPFSDLRRDLDGKQSHSEHDLTQLPRQLWKQNKLRLEDWGFWRE